MGIKQLMTLINEKAPKAVKHIQMDMLTGKVVACDASMAIYQFIIATQTAKSGFGVTELTDDNGNLTGHLSGLFNRSIQFMENGVKPIWVFDGKPPDMKSGELQKRQERKKEAEEAKEKAIQEGDVDRAKQMAGRSVKVTDQMIIDAKDMLRMMGIPVVEAPCEAEAQCAELIKKGKAYGIASEDMDSLTFGGDYLLRGFNAKKEPITQIELAKVLEGFEMSMPEFIDLCILCGCDYTCNIQGVGPVKAFNYIRDTNGTIEAVL
jgi:flap endonuclease-1